MLRETRARFLADVSTKREKVGINSGCGVELGGIDVNPLIVCAQSNICSCICKHTLVLSPEAAQASQHVKALSSSEKPCLASKHYFSS